MKNKQQEIRPGIFAAELAARGDKSLFVIEEVTLEQCLDNLATPFFATSLGAVEQRARLYQDELKRVFPKSEIHYAVKANFALPILKTIVGLKCGLDIVSIGEWHAALAAGCEPAKICFAGVGKTQKEVQETLSRNIGYLNVEHLDELAFALDFLMRMPSLGTTVSLRLNPCVEVETHPHLKTGAMDSKFGILLHDIVSYLKQQRILLGSENFCQWVKPLKGIHVHVGSQLHKGEILGLVAENVAKLVEELLPLGINITHFDMGGGLGVSAHGVPLDGSDIVKHVALLAGSLHKSLASLVARCHKANAVLGENLQNVSVALEPGRSIVASSTVLFTSVLYTKVNRPATSLLDQTASPSDVGSYAEKCHEHWFAYVDAGMNDFPRPSLYSAKHHVEWVATNQCEPRGRVDEKGNKTAMGYSAEKGNNTIKYKVVGPVCESGDVLATDVPLPLLHRGDILAFFEAGAYCRSMASHYNLRPLPGEIFIRGNEIAAVIQPLVPCP